MLPWAYNNGPPVLEERNDARERYQQAVAIQIQHQQRLAPVTETQPSAHPSQSESSAWSWVDHLRGQFHTPQSGKEPLLPMWDAPLMCKVAVALRLYTYVRWCVCSSHTQITKNQSSKIKTSHQKERAHF